MTGTYSHTLDAKGRLFIPARLRDELGDVFYVTLSGERCLNGYSEERWEEFRQKVRALTRSEQIAYRPLFSHAAKCELDAQGRILIPKELRDFVGLKKNVTIIGNNDIAEFWDTDTWNPKDDMEIQLENLQKLFESGII